MSTSVLKALPGKLNIKRHSPSILYISASLAMSTSVFKALPGQLVIKRHSPSILYILAILAMPTSVLKALPGKLDIKKHSPSNPYLLFFEKDIFRLYNFNFIGYYYVITKTYNTNILSGNCSSFIIYKQRMDLNQKGLDTDSSDLLNICEFSPSKCLQLCCVVT